jgi:hypothetical protein
VRVAKHRQTWLALPAVLHRKFKQSFEDDYSRQSWLDKLFGMPEISRFLGIVITMFYNDHEPPHFHAVYGQSVATISINDESVTGEFPVRPLRLVLEWTRLHKDELLKNWELAKQRKPLERIVPLNQK